MTPKQIAMRPALGPCDSCAQAVIPEMVELLKECLEAIEMEYGVCEGCTTDPCMKCRTKALLAKVQGGQS